MKILWSFNTKLDEHELYDAIQKNWQWNAIMMKKHRVFLVHPMIWMLFAFMAFWLLIWFAYEQFYNSEYMIIFRILTIAYSWVTLVRCVHSLRMIIYDIKYQSDSRDWYIDTIDTSSFKEGRYESFLKHSFVSMWLQIVLMIANSIVSFVAEGDATSNLLFNIIWIIVNIWFLFLLYKVLDRIIDYEMDFNIFTVDQFILYRQHWFFKTESLNIATSTIKIVQESKSWFMWSLFNYWKVSIHPEWNLWNDSKAIELFYVPYPKKLTKKLNEFIEKSKEKMNVAVAS
jgi:hypothetical protein